jgi:hypothetical protein
LGSCDRAAKGDLEHADDRRYDRIFAERAADQEHQHGRERRDAEARAERRRKRQRRDRERERDGLPERRHMGASTPTAAA